MNWKRQILIDGKCLTADSHEEAVSKIEKRFRKEHGKTVKIKWKNLGASPLPNYAVAVAEKKVLGRARITNGKVDGEWQ
jgi:hypothetical protein